ncbi:DUF1850 domain-containing protein [Pararhodobacter aggregans]|uniref:DUF1850 domain-containing protein n=1 Tax=Pararhodobacter aggregans TaxID=404875 RepID=A0A2T7UUL5_9RHOB|nr:DUF1850 domain-containing protein [Pararhodobacter aggregans]PTX04276.1 uncharacterized protein DUF1850 [Pararhodobacter aggregans]PVE48286.1 DUF1850 domain-containing protein [Pararhodobacter aggregans]
MAALLLCLVPGYAPAAEIRVSLADSGEVLARLPIEEGGRWSVLWHHSVDGYEVEDVYEDRDGIMLLVRSHLPDFGAGLGHIPGRGRQTSDGAGGYWIEDIDEPVPGNAYVLRPGRAAVNHRLRTEADEISLTALAEHRRVRIALIPDP